jgi:WD40 repeat protein
MSTSASSFYVTGGTLAADAPSYVERRADRDLHEGLTRGEFCYVLTSRQMGKSSLMARTAARLRQGGVAVVVLDLTAIGQNLTPEQWYDGLLVQLGAALDLEDELDDFWREHPRLGPLQRWMAALQDVVLARVSGRVTLFVDEIDTVQSLPFSTDEFFAGIRECYNRRAEDPAFERLTFCLLGVASPSGLIRETRTTPFNIGRRIELADFSAEEAASLAQGLGQTHATGPILLQRVLHWTGGHPYLTQRLCRAVAEDPAASSSAAVDRHCERLFLSHRARERDDNLLFVGDRLLRSEGDVASLLSLYARARNPRQKVADDETNPLVSVLRLSGIVRERNGFLRVRNRIYARVFDASWSGANTPDAEVRRLRAMAREEAQKRRYAEQQRRLAEERERTLRRFLYTAQMNLAHQAWEAGDVASARTVVEAWRPGPGQEDLRGFEWRYLWRLCRQDARCTLPGGPPLAFSPDGRVLATGGQEIKLWEVASQRVVAVFPVDVVPIAFSPDGTLLAAWGRDGAIRLWNIAAKQELVAVDTPHEGDRDFAFSPNGNLLAVISRLGVRIYSIPSLQETATFQDPDRGFRSLAFSPDGRLLATGSHNDVQIWDLAAQEVIAVFKGHTALVTAVRFSPDGACVASASDDSTLKLWEVIGQREVTTFRGHRTVVFDLAYSPDGSFLASASDDRTVKLWDVASRLERATFRGHTALALAVAFSPDGTTLASGSATTGGASGDAVVKLWDTTEGDAAVLRGHTGPVASVALAPGGGLLASRSEDHSIRLWDLVTQKEIHCLSMPSSGRRSIVFSLDGGMLAIGSEDGAVQVWDVRGRRELATLRGHQAAISSMAISVDGETLVTSSAEECTVILWDLRSGRVAATLRVSGSWSRPVALSPDGRTIAVGSSDRTVRLWDVTTREEVAILRGHQDTINDVAFSPDGRILASCGWDHSVRLWDTGMKEQIASIQGHAGIVGCVMFLPDGQTLASGAADHTVRLWNLATNQAVAILAGHRAAVMSCAASLDGALLATGSIDSTVRLWRAASFAETDSARGNGTKSSRKTARSP